MDTKRVTYKTSRNLPVVAVWELYRRTGWNDWFSRSDVRWYLEHALYVVSAWQAQLCVGIAVLTGDGRISVSLDLLLVDEPFRKQGIGSSLMRRVVARIDRLEPYHVAVDVFERRTERFYERFGFQRNKGTWLLEHGPTADRLRRLARIARGQSR